MASIFTYDPNPSRVASPWLTPTDSPKPSTPQPSRGTPPSVHLADYGVSRLEAEPQDGPTEYKLHLLLRPRRVYSSSSTSLTSGAHQYEDQLQNQASLEEPVHIHKSSKQSRQSRLQSLTTQLLWRMQQSAPYHASSVGELVIPKLPEAAASNLNASLRVEKLFAGLEESRGALYEIGVSDDGTFVGLTKDEMDESLKNLRVMAASLGCNIEVIKMVVVGDCEWYDESSEIPHQEQLWVAEVLIKPDLSSRTPATPKVIHEISDEHETLNNSTSRMVTEQLRITLTGPTTSGKTSLLGTLSTATLDNGRGKSRLSLLKHRHEIESGVTSAVAQELIGYKNDEVINYASGNVSSWTDIHASAEEGRLVFVSDSAGHPRYRRTTVRGLVGWAPHWFVLCIAADDGENVPSAVGGTSSAQDILGSAGAGVDLGKAHLELCLRLEKPLAIVITKLDLASKTSLRQTLSKILSIVKASGRTPSLLPPDPSKSVTDSELGRISLTDNANVRKLIDKFKTANGVDLISVVPIILTSAAKGSGIRCMHALLQILPIPPRPTSDEYIGPVLNPEQPACLFHIEDVFGLPAAYENVASNNDKADSGIVVAGYLRFGSLSVGENVVIGPFPADSEERDITPENSYSRSSPNSFKGPLSHPSATELARIASRNQASASVTKGEWHVAKIASIRNLRLPVYTLESGQVGTIGVVFSFPQERESFEDQPPSMPRIRKGMVMAIPSRHMIQSGHTLQAAKAFTASFEDSDVNSVTPGSVIVVYIASVRATARVLQLSSDARVDGMHTGVKEMDDDIFGLDFLDKKEELEPVVFGSDGVTNVTFELMAHREWIELGSQVLIMPGGGTAGLEGYVGRVMEVVD